MFGELTKLLQQVVEQLKTVVQLLRDVKALLEAQKDKKQR